MPSRSGGRSRAPLVSRIFASTAQRRSIDVRAPPSRTAATNAGTQAVSDLTWSTQVISVRPIRSASATFSAIVFLPSEKVEWTCMSWTRLGSDIESRLLGLHRGDLLEVEEALLEAADHRQVLERQDLLRQRRAE